MNVREENQRTSPSSPLGDLESPFREEGLLCEGSKEEWEPRVSELVLESPFQSAFEQDRTSVIEPEDLEEQLAKEIEESEEDYSIIDEGEIQDEVAVTDSEEDSEGLYDEETHHRDEGEEPEEEEHPQFEEIRSQENEPHIAGEEEGVYPPEESEYEEEEPSLDEAFFIIPEEFLRLLSPGAVIQRVRQLLGEGAFGLSLLGRFASGQIWNEDHLGLEILFHREPRLRPVELEGASDSRRLSLLYSLAVTHQRELTPVREGIVRPIFGNPANFQSGPVGECQIQDLRKEVHDLGPLEGGKSANGTIWYKRSARLSPRKQAAVDSIVLHHMGYNIGNNVHLRGNRQVGAHYIVAADGQIAQLYDDLDFLNSSNGFNQRCVAIEFAGNFPDERYHWWKSSRRTIPDRCYVTPAQIRAGRYLLATIKARLPSIKYLYAHRQSSNTRATDPGPDVWFNIGEWALSNLNLTDREPHPFVGTGQAIPNSWRTVRLASSKTAAAPPLSTADVAKTPAPVSAVPHTGGVPSAVPDIMPSRLGTLVFRREGREDFRYDFTPEDLLWTARLISGEAGARDDLENRAVIAAMLNRFALFTNRVYRTFSRFLRAYSTPLQPILLNQNVAQHYMNDPRFRRLGGTYPGTDIPRGQLQHHLDLQNTPWERLRPLARTIALEALMGRMPDGGIGVASEFASTWILYGRRVGDKNRTEAGWRDYTQRFRRDKDWRWIGDKPNLDQKRNAFFIDPRAANLAPDSVQVVAPS